MNRRSFAPLAVTFAVGASLLVASPAFAGARPHLKISPASRLTNNQTITISGSGLGRSRNGSIATWFASECTIKSIGVSNLDPDFSPHCAPSLVQTLHVSPRGSFSVKFKVATGKVADGVCGVPGHLTCVIAVGTGTGQHVTAKIRFKIITAPPVATTTSPPKSK